DAIYWEDDVRYCANTLRQEHRIVIQFDHNPPYVRTYACNTPAICDQQAKLWLQGAYQYGTLVPPNAATLLSALKVRHSLMGDAVLRGSNAVVRLPSYLAALLSEGSATLCRISKDLSSGDCILDKPTFATSTIRAAPGLYGVYRESGKNAKSIWKRIPRALVLVVPPGSPLLERWQAIPEAFRNDESIYSVLERRMFLIKEFLGSNGQ